MPLSQIDSYYYGGLVIAPLNIVLYNVFSSHGANLYGTSHSIRRLYFTYFTFLMFILCILFYFRSGAVVFLFFKWIFEF